MKALWVMWYDYEYIDKAIDAGIDTLIVTAFDLPKDPPSNHFDPYDKIVECLEYYKNKNVKIFLNPIWNRNNWYEIPLEQRLFFNGEYHKFTACIANKEFIASRINPAVELYKRGLCDGIIWDVEEYNRGTGKDVIEFFTEKNKCECINCKDLSWKEQWKIHQDYCKELLKDVPINGHFPTREVWSLKRYPNENYLFVETTYGGIEIWKTIKLFLYKLRNRLFYNLKYTLVPGLWVEYLPYEDFFKEVKKSLIVYGGYWIFAQKIFSRYSKNSTESLIDAGCINTELVDDEFFERLKKINKS